MRDTLRRLEEASGEVHRYQMTISGGEVRGVDDNGFLHVIRGDAMPIRELSRLASERARVDFDRDDDLMAGYLHGRGLSKERIHAIDTPNITIGRDGKVETTFRVVAAELRPEELRALGEYVMGQCSDGWGEGFEQNEFKIDGEEYYVSTWSRGARATVKKL